MEIMYVDNAPAPQAIQAIPEPMHSPPAPSLTFGNHRDERGKQIAPFRRSAVSPGNLPTRESRRVIGATSVKSSTAIGD